MRTTPLIVGLTLGATILAAPMTAIAAEESPPAVDPVPSESQSAPSESVGPDVGSDPAPDLEDAPSSPPVAVPSSEPTANVATEPPTGEPRPEVTAAATISIALSRSQASYGDSVVVTGSVAPDTSKPTVTVERLSSAGGWQQAGTVKADVQGRWSFSSRAEFNTAFRARITGAVSSQANLSVRPKLRFTRSLRGPTLVGAKLTATIQPAQYRGRVTIQVNPVRGKSSRITRQIRNGRLNVRVPTRFVGSGKVTVKLPAASGMAATSARTRIRATTRNLRIGSRGAEVRALVRHLKSLRFHTPRATRRYTGRVGDVVLAFRKSRRMARNKTMNRRTWRAVAAARPMRPRYRRSGTHIEVDKTRQIMMVVRNRRVIGTMHVSTGKTGNTPEGRFRVNQRGGSYLYRFMAFVGNFGIHGYNPVPLYPASHGCVREPMWAASWTWRKTRYGTPVYIYR